jgi:hypothetical protein
VGYGFVRVSTRHVSLTNVGFPVPFFFIAFSFFVENRMGGYYLAAEKKQEESQVSKVLCPKPLLIMFSDGYPPIE